MTPPSGYFYKVPETGAEFEAGDLNALVFNVRRHYSINALTPPADIADCIEHFLCIRNPASMCKGEYIPGEKIPLVINLKDIKAATHSLSAEMRRASGGLVPQLEAEARAEICSKCGDNKKGICTSCNGLGDYVVRAVGARTTNNDSKIGFCKRSLCLLRVKVHACDAIVRARIPLVDLSNYPRTCWLYKENSNG